MFLLVLATTFASTAFSIWAVTLDNSHNADQVLLYISHTGYLITHNMSTPAYVLYIISLSDTWHKMLKNKLQMTLLIAPFGILVALLIVNLFTDCVFEIADHTYVRGELFFVLYAIAVFYMVYGLVYLFRCRKILSRSKILAISAMVPLMLLAIMVQFINPRLVVEMFAGAIALLLITMTTQRPEELIDVRTGLGNYNAYVENVKRSFANNKSFTVIMLNISSFLSMQSMLSYDSTIMLLRSVGEEINKAAKHTKLDAEAYYLDRGRFRIVTIYDDKKLASETAETLLETLRKNHVINSLAIEFIPNICVTNCPDDVSDFTTLISLGGNFHDKSYNTGGVLYAAELFKQDRFDMANNIDIIIEKALKNNSFKVYYQPIYSVEKGRFSTAEALLRLIDSEYGFVPPDMFIAAAERNGAIHKIGDFVLEEVCRFIASDKFAELGLDYIEINLSVTQCMHADLADKVMATLKKYNLTPDKINLEITETAVAYAQSVMRQNLDKLSGAGVSFSLDDYGTGYSNMRRMIQLPLKIVKLDKSFVDEQSNPKMWIAIQNTVKMLKDMNMEIVVEGIETQTMAKQFTDLNCDYIQGYYYSKPIPEDDFVEFIRKTHIV
ncbi:MAG: EAL domain-containing protein [Ruminiclostridium sp.]|nr:EAL domain-containing protein [Ruminiclostridium sp.]